MITFTDNTVKQTFVLIHTSYEVEETLISYMIYIALISNFNLQYYLLKTALEQTSSFIHTLMELSIPVVGISTS